MDTTFAWMIGGGRRTDELGPDARTLSHLIAIRDAQRDASEPSPIARLAAWFGYQPTRITATPVALCCTPA